MTAGGAVGRWATDEPLCAFCAGPGSGDVAPHHLTHGVTVHLCEGHRSDEYQRRRGGQDFAKQLAGLWGVSGVLSERRLAALTAHLRRVAERRETTRARPGSYSWPRLRAEAERRFAAGEPPRRVIAELRERHSGGDADVPSVRTMRRWFCEARWLVSRREEPPEAATPQRTRYPRPSRIMTLPEVRDLARSLAEPYSWAFWGWSRGSPP